MTDDLTPEELEKIRRVDEKLRKMSISCPGCKTQGNITTGLTHHTCLTCGSKWMMKRGNK